MNSAHLHLIATHLPIAGVVIGTFILLVAMVLKKSEVKLTALGVLIFSALASCLSYFTGEGAEEIIENIPGISETLIHTHEELAESFFILTLIVGASALVTFIAELNKFRYTRWLTLITLALAVSDGVLAKFVGTSGGEIRHTEIRSSAKVINLEHDQDD